MRASDVWLIADAWAPAVQPASQIFVLFHQAQCQLLLQSRNASQQRDAVISGFPAIPAWFRRLFPYSKWGAEANAWITPTFFTWLVGPMEIEEAEIEGIRQHSQVHIKRCRSAFQDEPIIIWGPSYAFRQLQEMPVYYIIELGSSSC